MSLSTMQIIKNKNYYRRNSIKL